MAHKWATWLHNPNRLGGPLYFRAGDIINSGPQVGSEATKPLPLEGCPPLQGGTESEVAEKWTRWLHNPCRLGDPFRFTAGDQIKGGPQVARWLNNPYRLRGPLRFRAEDEITSGPQVGKVAI